jgi:hypothetical protein
MLLEPIEKEEKDHYGDPSHLMYFRTRPESYRQLLSAIRETVGLRGLRMPIIPEDVFGRHEFLGGIHALRGMSQAERRRYFKSLLSDFASEVDAEGEGEEEDVVELDVIEEPSLFMDLFEFISNSRLMADASDETHLKQLKVFFRIAESNGDLCAYQGDPEESHLLQYIIDSGEQADTTNSSEESQFFEHHKKSAALRRSSRES